MGKINASTVGAVDAMKESVNVGIMGESNLNARQNITKTTGVEPGNQARRYWIHLLDI